MQTFPATQMFTALYTFVMYFENTNFLYEEVAEVDFYGSFYCGVAGAIANFFGGMILFFDDDVTTPVPIKKLQPDNLLFRDFRFKKPEVREFICYSCFVFIISLFSYFEVL